MRGLALILFGLCAVPCGAAWVVDERGTCVEQWGLADLLRGPTAIVNAPLLPFRSAAGGWQMAREDRTPGFRRKVLLPVMLTTGGAVMGFGEALLWLGGGLGDTLTGGALSLAPDEATHLSAAPFRPSFVAPRKSTTDACGRSVTAAR